MLCLRYQTQPLALFLFFLSSFSLSDKEIFTSTPSLCLLHTEGFKALLTQQWFEWFVYTVGLCLLVTIQSFLMAYCLSIPAVPGIKAHPLFMTLRLAKLNAGQLVFEQPLHFGIGHGRIARLVLHSCTQTWKRFIFSQAHKSDLHPA